MHDVRTRSTPAQVSRWPKGALFTLGEYDLVIMAFEECGRTRVHRVRTQGKLNLGQPNQRGALRR